ncbi:hypothetical protein AAHH72_12290 [Bacillus cereus]
MKKTKVKEIRIVFENSDSITVPVNDISYLHINDIKHSVSLDWHHGGNLNQYKHCNELKVLFKNKDEYKRVHKFNDVTQLHLKFEDGSNDWFYLPWVGEAESNNAAQEVTIERGAIKLVVKETL